MVRLSLLSNSSWQKWILLVILLSIAALWISPVSAENGVTIVAKGDQSYYYGEEVVFSGENSASDFVYLFIMGPNVPPVGGKLTSPRQKVVSGDPNSFDIAKTKSDKTWEYTFYTSEFDMGPGTYTVYAVSQPKTYGKEILTGVSFGSVYFIFKKPFISAEISPSVISKGEPVHITGYADGRPTPVQIWIIGDNYFFNTTTPVNSDASYNFNIDKQISETLAKGQYYLIVQHPMQNNQLDVTIKDIEIIKTRSAKWNALEGKNALLAALTAPNIDDTYTEIPFFVDDTGIRSGTNTKITIAATKIPASAITTVQTIVLTPATTAPILTTTPTPKASASAPPEVTIKDPTPWQTTTPAQPSPLKIEIGIIATIGAALLIMRRK